MSTASAISHERGRPKGWVLGSASLVILADLAARTLRALSREQAAGIAAAGVAAAGLGDSGKAFRASLKPIRAANAWVTPRSGGRIG